MKKIFLTILIMIGFMPLMVKAIELPEKTDHEKVNIYIFRGHGCAHCYEALEFFYNNIEKYEDYFNVYSFEVWENKNNSDFMQEVANAFETKISGVPFIVIGDDYTNTKGFSEEISDEIVEAALNEYQNNYYVDLVGDLAKEHGDDLKMLNLEESCEAEGIIAGKYDTVIIVAILVLVIGGGSLLIKLARK